MFRKAIWIHVRRVVSFEILCGDFLVERFLIQVFYLVRINWCHPSGDIVVLLTGIWLLVMENSVRNRIRRTPGTKWRVLVRNRHMTTKIARTIILQIYRILVGRGSLQRRRICIPKQRKTLYRHLRPQIYILQLLVLLSGTHLTGICK